MRILLALFLLFSLPAFAQISRELQPKNSIQISDSSFIGQTEITNRMYREFVQYVKDSMFTHLLYDSLPFERAKYFLNLPENRIKKIKLDNRSEYAKIYGLNYERWKTASIWDSTVIEITKPLFYPQAERFYRRREVDERKLKYTMPSGELIAIFPDTLSWVNDYYVKYEADSTSLYWNWSGSYTNMYFWHPAYDNYPIVGLNFDQIMAYCHWYSRQLNENSIDPEIQYTVSLPTVEDYQKALKICAPAVIRDQIRPESAFDLIVYERESPDACPFVHKVYSDFSMNEIRDSASVYKAQ